MNEIEKAIRVSLCSIDVRAIVARRVASGEAWEELPRTGSREAEVDRALEACRKLDIRPVTIADPSYPGPLKQLTDPPYALFVKGDETSLSRSVVAVVGSRRADLAGCEIARDFGHVLGHSGHVVASGLALGVDGAAHEGALASGKRGATIAVLAHGLDSVYPSTHEHLAKAILDGGGCLASEYPPGYGPRPYHFLERNRIVAGLSRAVVVIQAGERSGALVTARLAAEAGRDVYVVPGSIRDPRYRGSNRLIQDGASLVPTPFDLPGLTRRERELGDSIRVELTDPQKLILAELVAHGPLQFNELESAGMDVDLHAELLHMETVGVIERMPGNVVRAVAVAGQF